MPIRGIIHNGIVAPKDTFPWPEGTEVTVELAPAPDESIGQDEAPSLYDRLKPVVGAASGLPADLAENHDRYLHPRPRQRFGESEKEP